MNKGNLLELLDSYNVLVPELKEKLARRYGHYTSPEYQNDIVHCLARQLREKTVQSVKYWALLVDETKDVSRKEQLSFIIRFVGENGDVNEKPIGVYHMKHTDAASLISAIIDIVDKLRLNWNYLFAQCYDGASVMSGEYSGVETRIRAKTPQAIYVPCHAHCLNLALVHTVKNISEVRAFFGIVQQICLSVSEQ